ncbi:MAG: hypothetical protein AB1512_09935 [Thermodesulfobacteriota bacterium]
MAIQEKKAQKSIEGEEDLLNFDLDDLSLEEVDQAASGEEEEIIELTDLVEKGVAPDQQGRSEIADLLEEENSAGTAEIELGTKELAGLDGLLKEEGSGKAEAALEIDDLSLDFSEEEKPLVEEKVVEEEISDTDLAEILKEEGAEVLDLGGEEAVVAEVGVPEELISAAAPAAALKARAVEQLSVLPAQERAVSGELVLDLAEEAAREPEPVATPPAERPRAVPEAPAPAPQEAAPVQPLVGISEEKLEGSVTQIVEEVVERVTRQTLENTVERVVRETLDNMVERVARETLENVLERAVHDSLEGVAERVARETMAGVAERVILQAIDALKQSLEAPSN